MKFIIILLVCVIACVAEYYTLPKDPYTSVTIRNNDAEIKRRSDCFLGRRPCTPLLLKYRNLAPDMISNSCAKCSPELKALIQAYIDGVKEKYPADYRELVLKFDPTGTKTNDFEEAVGIQKRI